MLHNFTKFETLFKLVQLDNFFFKKMKRVIMKNLRINLSIVFHLRKKKLFSEKPFDNTMEIFFFFGII
jgi:hypothetical protein